MSQTTSDPNIRPGQFSRVSNILTRPSSALKDAETRRGAEIAAGVTFTLFVFSLIGFLASLFRNGFADSIDGFFVPIVSSGLGYLFSRTRFFRFGTFIFTLGFCASPYISIMQNPNIENYGELVLIFVPLGLVIASGFLSWPAILLLTILNEAMLFSLGSYGFGAPQRHFAISGVILTIGMALIFLNNYRQGIEKLRLNEITKTNRELEDIKRSLEQRVQQRTEELNRRSLQLEAASLVSRAAAEVQDLGELLKNVVMEITDRFGFYHTGIFLSDSAGQYMVLMATSSEGGKRMLARGHRLAIGRQGIVGYAAYQKRSRIAQDVGIDAVFFNNPDLPETHSEVALPLLVRNRLIGVLDIQSREKNAFTLDDISTLQTMADQIALAIENARLIEESRTAILGLERLTTENTRTIWKERMGGQVKGYHYTPIGITPLTSEPIELSNSSSERAIKIPINLRGKAIGNISLQRKSNDTSWSEAEKEMAERIATQVALAVENARLLEESQRRAIREQTVNEFSNRFGRSLDVDTLLQNAVRELHRLPQVSEVSVFINPAQETQKK